MKRMLQNLFLRDVWLKLLSLAIAFLMWSTFRAEPFVEIGYMAPLEFRNIPEKLEISGNIPTQVQVRVRGRSAVLRRLTPADLAVTVDLQGWAEGETQVHLTGREIDAPLGAEIVRIWPSDISVKLVPRKDSPDEALH